MKLLAVDLGASGGRVLAGTLAPDAGTLSMEEVHRFPHGPGYLPHDGGQTLHWNVLHLWEEIRTGLRRAGVTHGRPAAIGVDTWGVDFALLDRDGALLANPVAYRDSRTDGMVEAACALVSREEIFQRTGIQFMALNSLFQLLALSRRQPHLLEITAHLLPFPDLFHYWLCGSKTAEFTMASTTQMVDPHRRDWDREMLDRLGLPHGFLPPVVEPGSRLGSLRPALAEELGLPAATEVLCPAAHDTASAVVATPGEGDDWAFLSAGTWCLFGAEVSRPHLDPAVLEAGFGNEGGVCGTTRLLRNITGLWLVQECRRQWLAEGHDFNFAELVRLAERARPFRALLDPDDLAFAQPTRMPQAIAEYCARTGQEAPESIGEFVRAALDGIALTVRFRWEQLEAILGRPLRVLHVVGGGSQNTLFCQLVADALGRTVLAGPTEATAMGNALVQAVGLGVLDYPAARAVVRRSVRLTEYRPRPGGGWDDAYGRFRRLRGPG